MFPCSKLFPCSKTDACYRAEKLYATALDLYDAVLLPCADGVQRAELQECRSRVAEKLAGCRSQVADMGSEW